MLVCMQRYVLRSGFVVAGRNLFSKIRPAPPWCLTTALNSQEERNEAGTCDPSGFSKFPYLGRENSERLLLREGVISRIPRSLCGNSGAKNVILVVGDGMGWEMTRAGVIAKKVVAELTTRGCNVATGCPGNQAVLNAFAGRTLSNYYLEGTTMFKRSDSTTTVSLAS